MDERRFEKRLLCAQLVRVEWTLGQERFGTSEAVLEDISALGGCVQLETGVPIGTPIELSIDPVDCGRPTSYRGHVCYCAFRDYGYFVGIRFSDKSRWSSASVVPAHLLSLEALAMEALVPTHDLWSSLG